MISESLLYIFVAIALFGVGAFLLVGPYLGGGIGALGLIIFFIGMKDR